MTRQSAWASRPLGELVENGHISYGIVQPGADTPGGVAVVRVKDVRDGHIDQRSPIRVDPGVSARHRRTVLRGGELLISIVGTVGESAVVPRAMAGWNVARAIAVIRPVDISPRWLRLCLQTAAVRQAFDSMLNTTVQATLNLADLKRLRIPVPPEPVRAAIAEVLGALDDKIANNAALMRSIDMYLEALTERMLASSPGWTALGDIADVNAASVKPRPGGQLRYLDIAAVGVGSFAFPEVSNWENAPGRARRRLRRGDTIWSTVRPNRRSHALNLIEDEALVASTGLAVLSPRETGFAFLYQATKLPQFTAFLESVADGSAYPAVRAERFEEAPVPLASEDQREKFEAAAAPLRERAHAALVESHGLAAMRDALLPLLMSGKVRVKDAEQQLEGVV